MILHVVFSTALLESKDVTEICFVADVGFDRELRWAQSRSSLTRSVIRPGTRQTEGDCNGCQSSDAILLQTLDHQLRSIEADWPSHETLSNCSRQAFQPSIAAIDYRSSGMVSQRVTDIKCSGWWHSVESFKVAKCYDHSPCWSVWPAYARVAWYSVRLDSKAEIPTLWRADLLQVTLVPLGDEKRTWSSKKFQEVPRSSNKFQQVPTSSKISNCSGYWPGSIPQIPRVQRIPEASRAHRGRESGVNLRSHAGNTEMLTQWDTENLNLWDVWDLNRSYAWYMTPQWWYLWISMISSSKLHAIGFDCAVWVLRGEEEQCPPLRPSTTLYGLWRPLEAVACCVFGILWIVCQKYFARLARLPRLATMPALSNHWTSQAKPLKQSKSI